MPRPSGSEMPPQQQQERQRRQSPRARPHLKTTSADSNGAHAHHRGSPKPEDVHRRSPCSPLPESPARNQRKSGSRVADLEAKLGHAQEELRKLREQLASAEAAKRDAEQELQEAKNLVPTAPPCDGEQVEEEYHISIATQLDTPEKGDAPPAEASPAEEGKIQVDPVEINAPELVPAAGSPAEPFSEEQDNGIDVKTAKEDVEVSGDDVGEVVEEEEAASRAEKTEVAELEAELAEKMEEHEHCWAEASILRRQLAEAEGDAAAARASEEETAMKLSQAMGELAQSQARVAQLSEQLQAAEWARASLETEMKRLRVQTEQWQKATDAAAAALSATEAGGRRAAERYPSMDKHLRAGLAGEGSPLEEGLGAGRRKGAGGIRVLGDLWKKKAQHK